MSSVPRTLYYKISLAIIMQCDPRVYGFWNYRKICIAVMTASIIKCFRRFFRKYIRGTWANL
jgi:hypothetical protein